MSELQPHGQTHWSNTAHPPRVLGMNANVAVLWVLCIFFRHSIFIWFTVIVTALAIWVQVINRMTFASAFRTLRILLTGRIKPTRSPLRAFLRK